MKFAHISTYVNYNMLYKIIQFGKNYTIHTYINLYNLDLELLINKSFRYIWNIIKQMLFYLWYLVFTQ